jgi:hypothetical protein
VGVFQLKGTGASAPNAVALRKQAKSARAAT